MIRRVNILLLIVGYVFGQPGETNKGELSEHLKPLNLTLVKHLKTNLLIQHLKIQHMISNTENVH